MSQHSIVIKYYLWCWSTIYFHLPSLNYPISVWKSLKNSTSQLLLYPSSLPFQIRGRNRSDWDELSPYWTQDPRNISLRLDGIAKEKRIFTYVNSIVRPCRRVPAPVHRKISRNSHSFHSRDEFAPWPKTHLLRGLKIAFRISYLATNISDFNKREDLVLVPHISFLV